VPSSLTGPVILKISIAINQNPFIMLKLKQ